MLSQTGEKELHKYLEEIFNHKDLDPAILSMRTAKDLIRITYGKGYSDGFEKGREDYRRFPRR